MRPLSALLWASALFALAPTLSAQTTWFVDATAPGPGTGSSLDPFPTIQQGVAAAVAGDTVQVAAGSYSGRVTVGVDDLRVVGAGPGLSILDASGQDAGFELVSSPPNPRFADFHLQGFTVQNASRWQVVLWRVDRPVLEDLELVGLGRNVPSPTPGTTAVTGLNLAEVSDALVDRVSARECYGGGVSITGGSNGNLLRDLTLSANSGDLAGFFSINLYTAPGVSVGGGANAVEFAGTVAISDSPRGLFFEDTPYGAITPTGGASLAFSNVLLPVARVGLGAITGLEAFVDDAGLRYRVTGGEPLLPTGEAYFPSFVHAHTAALLATDPSTILVFDRSELDHEVGVGLSLSYALANVPSGGAIFVHAGRYAGPFVLDRPLALRGVQRGTDARGRVVGAPDPLSEAILEAPGAVILELRSGCAGASVEGFAFEGGAVRALEATSGPLDGCAVRECHLETTIGPPVLLDAGGIDLDFERNVVRAAGGVGPALSLSTLEAYPGLRIRDNDILRVGFAGFGDTGLFADGDRNIAPSGARDPELSGNRFEGHGIGVFAGPWAFDGVRIAENVFRGQSFDGFLGGPKDSVFADNLFENNGGSGIALTSFGSADPLRGAQGCTLVGNRFVGQGGEAIFFSSLQAPGTMTTNVVHSNLFEGNATGALQSTPEGVDCRWNWWGDASGPSGDGSGLGDAAIGVLFDPWLSCPPDEGVYPAGDPVAVVSGDLDADGFVDLAISDRAGDAVRLRFNDDFALFPTETVHALFPGDLPGPIAYGGVLAGGAKGVAVAATGADVVRIVDPVAGVVASLTLPGTAPVELHAVELNGGGGADLVAVLAGDAAGNAGVAVSLDGLGFVLLPPPNGAPGWPSAVSVAVLDADGANGLDLAVAMEPNSVTPVPPGDVAFFRNDGLGGFFYDSSLSFGLAPGDERRAIRVADMDRDGLDDLVLSVATAAAGELRVVLGQGGLAYGPPIVHALDAAPVGLALLDLREDSLPGLRVDTEAAVLEPSRGILFVEAGFDGTSFQRREACAAGAGPVAFHAANLEAIDCLTDFVVCDPASGEVRVLLTGASALATPFGQGCAGGAGMPRFEVQGRPRFGSVVQFQLRDALPLAPAALVAGLGYAPPPGGGCLSFNVALPIFFFGMGTGPTGSIDLPFPIPPDLFLECGELSFQWIVVDALGGLFGDLSATQGVRLRIGD